MDSVRPPANHPVRVAIRADLLDFTDTPVWGDTAGTSVRFRPDHWLLIENGIIVGAQPEAPGPDWRCVDHRGRLLMPGFVDAHVHMPQIDSIASFGGELLEWLERHTFPAELAYADPEYARVGADRFVHALIAEGTTAAAVYPTVHRTSVDALFTAARRRGMRLIAGKVLQDRHSPDGLRDDLRTAERDTVDLIARWHGRDRLSYALTVRFAPASTDAQMAMAARFCEQDPDLYLQTHVAENRAEVDWARSLFPEARSYVDVYARARLLHPRSLLAHAIWIDPDDRAALADAGACIAHCPSSNLFLGSGLFDWPAAMADAIPVAIGSDVGAGTSLSMPRTLADAYKVQALRGTPMTAWTGLHAATRGAARALGLESEIGSLEPGCTADLCIWHWAADAVAERRLALAEHLHDRLFAWIMLADARNLEQVYVAGCAQPRPVDRRS